MLPFRSHPPSPLLREGYSLVADPFPSAEALNRLLVLGGDQPREAGRWQRVLERSIWHLGVERSDGELVGFVRTTSDLALNANLWDLCCDPADPARDDVRLDRQSVSDPVVLPERLAHADHGHRDLVAEHDRIVRHPSPDARVLLALGDDLDVREAQTAVKFCDNVKPPNLACMNGVLVIA